MNRMAITRINRQGNSFLACIVLNEKREFTDFSLVKEEHSILNNIYIARVEDIVYGIDAAFVRIEKEQKCFLPLSDIKQPIFTKKQSQKKTLCIGDELIVQVIREGVKTKDPVVSTKLTLQGRCSVLTTENCSRSVSKKLPDDLRKQYASMLHTLFPSAEEEEAAGMRDFGIIIRTAAASCGDDEVQEDVCSLVRQYESMKQEAIHKEAFSLLYREPPSYIAKLKTIDLSGIDEVVTDDEEICRQIEVHYPQACAKLRFYRDDVISLDRLYRINSTIDALGSSRVWLPSGANIIIEQLETLTFIDVNTAKNQSAKANTIHKVNMEAAVEIARQLKLRNISGMILIDFINMKSKEEEQELISVLKEEIKKDFSPCSFIDITKLGLVELTRKKQQKSLKEILNGFS